MKYLKNKELLKKFFIVFLIIQPLLDIYVLFSDGVVNFFKFSPSTIIRIFSIGILFVMVLISLKLNKKYLWFIIYGFLMIVYLILHHINASNFSANITGTYNYSIVSELFYIIRMLLPFVIAFITYHVNLNRNQIYKIFIYFILIISSVIVLTNITCLSLQSYSEGANLINSNIFGWFFNYNYTNVDLSSKGIFTSANQIGVLLAVLLPITIYYYFNNTESKKLTVLTLILQSLSLLMIGTRVSSYSWILVFITMLVIYIYYIFKKKNIFIKRDLLIYLSIFCLLLVIFKFAPINMRKYAKDYKDSIVSMEEKTKEEQKELTDKINKLNPNINGNNKELNDSIIEFISKNYLVYSINKEYIINIYNYKVDPVFWYNVMQMPYDYRSESRQIEQLITSRIYENNNNKLDKWFGMGFSTFRNGNLYLEQDFKVHFYTIGLIGSLLLIYPYIILLVICAIYLLVKGRNNNNFALLSYCFSIFLMIAFGYFSGSVLDQLIITLICGFIVGLIIKSIFKEEQGD